MLPDSPAPNPLKLNTLSMFLIFFLGTCIYINTFQAPLVFDDIPIIVSNSAVKDLNSFLQPGIWKNNRAFGLLTFAVNYRVHGTDVAGYHLVNLLIHVVCSGVLYFFVLSLFKSASVAEENYRPSGNTQLIAAASALLFVSHPVQTQAVTYVTQRFTSLATLLYLTSLLCYAQFRLHQAGSDKTCTYRGTILYAAGIISTLLAMRTKEIAFTIPFMIVVYEWLFFRGKITTRWLALIPFALTLPIIPLSLVSPDSLHSGLQALDTATHVDTSLGRYEYFLTQCRIIMTYLRLLIMPVNQNLDYDFPVYTSMFTPPVLLSFTFLVTVAGFTVFRAMRVSSAAIYERVIIFSIFLFFIGLSVESSIIPIKDVIFEHRLYLPSAGVMLAFSTAVVSLSTTLHKRWKSAPSLLIALMSLLILLLGWSSYQRNKVWQNELTLLNDCVRKSPAKARPLINLAAYYLTEKQPMAGMKYLQRAAQIEPKNSIIWYNMGMALGQVRRLDEAEQMFAKAIQLQPGFQNAYAFLAWTLEQNGKFEQALDNYRTALQLDPSDRRAQDGVQRLKSVEQHKQ